MLHSLRPLFYFLVLMIGLVPLAAATKLSRSRVQASPDHLRNLTPEVGNNPSSARLFTSTAAPALLDLSLSQFRDNITATVESHLSTALLQEIREFWFEHLDADSLIVASPASSLRWYAGGDEMDQQCV